MIYNFQALRALAALMVLFVHIDLLARPLGLDGHDMAFGNVGVDLFFVLSGFVIVHSTRRRPQSAGSFAVNRIVRVVPLYWLLTLGVFAVALVAPAMLNSTDADLVNLAKSLLFVPYQKENGLIQPVLFVGWTLNYEMFFYLVFAAALAMCASGARRAVWLSSAVLVAFVAWVQWAQPPSLVLRFFGYTIVLEFVMGMWIALMAERGFKIAAKPAAVGLAISGAWLIGHMFAWPAGPRWLLAGIPSALILICALSLEEAGHAIRHRFVQLLGAASYALYLSHPFVLQALGKVVAPFNNAAVAIPAILFGFVLAHAAGIAIHLFVEKPMVAALRQRIGRRAVGRRDLKGQADAI